MAAPQNTKTQNQLNRIQSQGSYPDAPLVSRSYSLFDTLKFNSSDSEYHLFGQTQGQTTKFVTNMIGSNSIPGGQNMVVFGISVALDQGATVLDADEADVYKAAMQFFRNSLWTFGRENADWDAKFHGSKLVPAVTILSETAGNRVGDVVKSSYSYAFQIPVVIGQNCSFSFDVAIPAPLLAGNKLVANNCSMKVFLDGGLTKKAAT